MKQDKPYNTGLGSTYVSERCKEFDAVLYYILLKCCHKYEEDLYKPIDYMQLKWIIDRCNYISGKKYNTTCVPYDYFTWFDDVELVPTIFDVTEWQDKKFPKHDYRSYISLAEYETINKVIFRWKLYGRFCQSISDWYWLHIKSKFLYKKWK